MREVEGIFGAQRPDENDNPVITSFFEDMVSGLHRTAQDCSPSGGWMGTDACGYLIERVS
jgi:hypothetical protein